jgi:iron complex outermembrane receptor protein
MNTFKIYCLFLFFPLAFYAQKSVQGTVVDDQGLPIPSINILVEGTDRGTTTDFDGNYSIELSNGEVLVFSYLGFKTKRVTYTGQSRIDVALELDTEQLEEVVLIGYGTSTKKDLTGSVTSITEDDFTKGNIVTPENLINGRVAGVTVNTGGAPGSGSEIRIRGGGSLNASNDPLIVVDGLPLGDIAGGSRSILSSINPNDIESFSVLKDAAATAIYGNRASGGVIIIKTKQGTKDLKVDFTSNTGFWTLPDKVDVFTGDEFRAFIADRFPDRVGLLGDANTDWQDVIYRTGRSYDNNLSVRGQLFESIPVRLSLGRFQQDGIRKTSEFARTSASLAVNPTFFDDHLRVNLNANYSRESNRFADGVEGGAIAFDPTQPVFDANSPFDGYFEYSSAQGFNQLAIRNPLAALEQRQNNTDLDRIYGNLNLDYRLHFLPEARIVVNMGIDDSSGSGTNELSRNSVGGVVEELPNGGVNYFGAFEEFTSDTRNTLFDAYFKYNNELADGVDLRATLGYSYQKFENESFTTFNQRQLTPIEPDTFVSPDLILIGYIGRAFVTLKDKYIFSYSIRRDGSSRFAEGNKWGTFQSAAFSWNISDEDFLKDSEVVSNLKLRTSYGETGQQGIGNRVIGTQGIVTALDTNFTFINGVPVQTAFPTASNPNITWETAKTINIGLDYGFFNDRITGSIDVYNRDTEDLFVFAPVPEGTTFTNEIDQNAGILNTQGLEFGINAQIFDAKGDKDKFDWNLNYNVTFIRQEIDELAGGVDINSGNIAGGTGGFIQRLSEGFPPNAFYVYNQVYDSNGRPIEGAYTDLNGDNQITEEDRYLFRDPNADVLMGLQSSMSYKNFDLSFNMRASFGNYLYNNYNSSNAQVNRAVLIDGVLNNLPTSVLNTNFQVTENVQLSDYFIEDASFLRMDNIQLGYTFTGINDKNSTLRLSATVQNAFVITEYSGLDPEIAGGIDNTIYPRARTFLFGLNFNF